MKLITELAVLAGIIVIADWSVAYCGPHVVAFVLGVGIYWIYLTK